MLTRQVFCLAGNGMKDTDHTAVQTVCEGDEGWSGCRQSAQIDELLIFYLPGRGGAAADKPPLRAFYNRS